MKKIILSAFITLAVMISTTSCKSDINEGGLNNDPVIDNPEIPDDNDPIEPNPTPTPPTPQPTPTPDLSGKRFVHRVLIDKATGLKCPNCPYMTEAIRRVKKSPIGDFVIPVAMFAYMSDQFKTEQSKWWCKNYYGCRGYPSAYINKSKKAVRSMDVRTVRKYIKKSSPVGIKINSKISSSQAKIDITFQFNAAYQGLKYTIYILENGIRANQAGRGVQVHNHIFTKCIWNKEIGSVTKGKQVSKTNSFDHKMHSRGTKNLKNMDIVVYVTNAKGQCIQVQMAKANTVKDFDFK